MNLGQIIVSIAIFGWTIMGYVTRVDIAQTSVAAAQVDIKALRNDMTTQIGGLRAELAAQIVALQAANNEQFRIVRSDIANLPEVKADMTQFNRRMDQADSRADAQSKRMDNIEKNGIQNAADIVNLLRIMGGTQKPIR